MSNDAGKSASLGRPARDFFFFRPIVESATREKHERALNGGAVFVSLPLSPFFSYNALAFEFPGHGGESCS